VQSRAVHFFFGRGPQTIRSALAACHVLGLKTPSVQVRSSQQLKLDMTPAKEDCHSLNHADIGHLGNQEVAGRDALLRGHGQRFAGD
jgi:hypothetical protein